MKAIKLIMSSTILAVIAMALFIVFPGCEKEPDTSTATAGNFDASVDIPNVEQELTVSPSSATAEYIGQKILFSVTDGSSPFTWTPANTSFGTITPNTGNDRDAIYNVLQVAKNTIIITDADGHSAQITITADVKGLTISPADNIAIVVRTNGVGQVMSIVGGATTYTFTGNGGVKQYHWSSSVTDLGTVAPTTGDSTDYTVRTGLFAVGTSVLTLTDDEGKQTSLKITTTAISI